MRKLFILALVPLLMATTCPPRVAIQPVPSAASRQPTFAFSSGGVALASLRAFEVTQCRPGELRRPLWRVSRPAGPADTLHAWTRMETPDSSAVLRITYGQVPEGYREEVAPEPLVPGRCYLAGGRLDYGGGAQEFRVTEDGGVRLGSSRGYFAAYESQMNRAGVHCKRAYRGARSPADTATVDARVQAVADTSITCGYLRTEHPEVIRTAQSREFRVALLALGAASIAWGIKEEIEKE